MRIPQDDFRMGGNVPTIIGIAFNLKKPSQDDTYEEYDEIETIEALQGELERYGFKVVLLEHNQHFLKNILSEHVEFVLNIAEGVGKTRGRESQVPCILENLGLPYSGSDPVALGITLDKYLTNLLLSSAGIPVPLMFMVKTAKEVDSLKGIFKRKKSFIVKPRWEGSSKGIFSNSIVHNFTELRKRVKNVLLHYHQPAVVEEFLERDEITTGVCGNSSPRILGMMKIAYRNSSATPFIYSLENKREWHTKIKYEPQRSIPRSIQKQITQYALKAFRTLELRDLARIDFRVDKNNIPKIIDINPLPGLSPHYSDLPILYRLKGKGYSELIEALLRESFKRHGFTWKH